MWPVVSSEVDGYLTIEKPYAEFVVFYNYHGVFNFSFITQQFQSSLIRGRTNMYSLFRIIYQIVFATTVFKN